MTGDVRAGRQPGNGFGQRLAGRTWSISYISGFGMVIPIISPHHTSLCARDQWRHTCYARGQFMTGGCQKRKGMIGFPLWSRQSTQFRNHVMNGLPLQILRRQLAGTKITIRVWKPCSQQVYQDMLDDGSKTSSLGTRSYDVMADLQKRSAGSLAVMWRTNNRSQEVHCTNLTRRGSPPEQPVQNPKLKMPAS